MRKAAIIMAAAALAAAVAVPKAAADIVPPPTLTGETFVSFTPSAHVTCDAGQGTFTYSASGVAAGPYPGTFTETGTVTLQTDATGPVIAFSASFSIDSPIGHVEGTKRQVREQITQGSCANLGPPLIPFADAVLFDPAIEYDATIQTATGTFGDHGSAFLHASGCDPSAEAPCPTSLVFEIFDSYLTQTEPLGPATVTVQPATATNPVGTQHTVTAVVTNAAGGPVGNVTVLFRVEGAAATTGSCSTDSSGTCNFAYTGPLLPGSDLITACADSNRNGVVDPGEPCGTGTKEWVLPASTAGHATGGGQTTDATFGFNAESTADGVRGECTVVDPASGTKVKCLDATVYVQTGHHATFFGTATVNDVPTLYRIDVDDAGEPNSGTDTFRIITASGYQAGGPVVRGNVQVH